MKLFPGFQELVFPPRCPGCGLLRTGLCPTCTCELRFCDYVTYVGNVPVFSSIKYGPAASHVLVGAKEDGVRISDDILTTALQRSLKFAIKNSGLRPTLVPIPHSKMATRRRGRNFVAEIAIRLAGLEILPIRLILQHNRRVDDQSKLDAPSRAGNLSGAMSVKGECGRPCEIILVDDLITTGVTLGEAVRTLEKVGFHVVASVTALVALPLR